MRTSKSLPNFRERTDIAIKNAVYGAKDTTFGKAVADTLLTVYKVQSDFIGQRNIPDGRMLVWVMVGLETPAAYNKLKRSLPMLQRDLFDPTVKIFPGGNLTAIIQFKYENINKLPEFAGTLH